jgi:two-component system cell cycle response regulator CpdR
MGVIVTSGSPLREDLPDGAKFWSKPWAPLDVIREAERAAYQRGMDCGAGPRRRS